MVIKVIVTVIYPFRGFRFFLSLTEIFERELLNKGKKGVFQGEVGCVVHTACVRI